MTPVPFLGYQVLPSTKEGEGGESSNDTPIGNNNPDNHP